MAYDPNEEIDPGMMAALSQSQAPGAVTPGMHQAVLNTPVGVPGVVHNPTNDRDAIGTPTVGDIAKSQGANINANAEPTATGDNTEKTQNNPWGTKFDVSGLSDWMKTQRVNDTKEGMGFAGHYFGEGNPQVKEILDTRRSRAMGLNGAEIQALRERASSGINAGMATNMRALRGVQATNGVRGGAAGAQAIPIVNAANQARANAERDIAIEDMKRRGNELDKYEGTFTNERGGLLGTALGWAGAGAADRSSALQYGIGKDQMNEFQDQANWNPDLNGEEPWNAQDAFKNWAKGGFAAGEDPLASFFHENVFDKNDIGINDNFTKPQNYIGATKNKRK